LNDQKKKPNTHSKSTIDSKKIEKNSLESKTISSNQKADDLNFLYNPSNLSNSKQTSVEVIDYDFQRQLSGGEQSSTQNQFKSTIDNYQCLNLCGTTGGVASLGGS
jgi:hypothetical protein